MGAKVEYHEEYIIIHQLYEYTYKMTKYTCNHFNIPLQQNYLFGDIRIFSSYCLKGPLKLMIQISKTSLYWNDQIIFRFDGKK